MELSFLMKLRIAAAAAAGIILIGLLAWPLAAPEPFGVVSVFAGVVSYSDVIILIALAVLTGLLAYFVAWPYGREIAPLAVPTGLAIWALRGGGMAELMLANRTAAAKQQLFASLRWEPVFWLAVIAAGLAGVLLGQKILRPKSEPEQTQEKADSKSSAYLNPIIAIVGSVLIAQIFIKVLARDTGTLDPKIGTVSAQPATGQIAFAVIVSFGLAGFVVKKFLDADYIWPTIASALVTAVVSISYAKQEILERLVARHPAIFFSHPVIAILPVQMVAFGTLGAITGYWLAVRYNYWRKYRMTGAAE